jgi:WD40 repeat protein
MLPRLASLLLTAFLLFTPGQAVTGEPPAPVAPARTGPYGDPLPKGIRFRLGTVRLRHDGDVMALAWLPDGRTLASAGWDCTVRLWQIPGGKQLAQWDKLGGVVFSPDGRSFACGEGTNAPGEGNRDICIIDVATGKERRRIRAATNGRALFNLTMGYPLGFYSPDGKVLAIRERESGVRLYAVDSGKELGHLKAKVLDFGRPVVFAPDSRSVLVAVEDGLFRWTFGTGAKEKLLADEKGTACSFAFSPDGKTLAAVVDGRTITLRSWPVGKELRRLRMNAGDVGGHNVLAFSPDGKLLASSEPGTIRLWAPATGEQVRRFEGLRDRVWDLAFSPDGSLLAAAGSDHAVTVWEVSAVKSPRPLTGVGHLLDLVGLAADGRTLLTRSADGVGTVWDSRDGRRLRTLADEEAGVERALFGPNASRARAVLRQEAEGRRRKTASPRERISCSAFSPDHVMLAVGSGNDGRILLVRKTSKGIEHGRLNDDAPVKEARKRGFEVAVSRLTFSPDGRTLAATYSDGRLILWGPRTGRPRHVLSFPRHGESYRSLEFSPDGRLLALSDRHALYLVESASGQRFRELPLGEHWVDSLAFAPDNRTLAVGDAGSPAAIHIWDLPTGKQIRTLRGHRDSVETLVFSPGGTFLLSGSRDGTVLSWDIAAVLRRRQAGKDLSPAKLSEFWTDLASKDAARAQRAVAELIQAPNTALPFLAKSLPPVRPEEMVRITSLIADLDHEEFLRRDKAAKELAKIGAPAAPALRKTLAERPSPEVRRRVASLLETVEARALSPDGLRILRALQVLETLGTPAAQRSLEHLAGGAAAAQLTLDAKAALLRLGRRYTEP